ncbi:MAG TPA: flagellar basal body L-ring protein FlgH [Rubrivivax sp.]|nr:flagellar basal body L-ring protein FlgH [Burkholderiales bacterium]HNU10046.1 flagellar basal body L-ring protein FlgH [Rubrivivax sp.]
MNSMAARRTLCLLSLLPLLGLLSGCLATVSEYLYPRVEMGDTRPLSQPPAAQALAAPPPATGAIFSAQSYRPLFEDHRARLIGDTLTVQITERVSATASSTSTVDKSGSVEAGISAFPGVKKIGRAGAAGNGANTFAGKGATQSSNNFSGTITVVVREVLPNGHLIVAGEKQIGVNNSVDTLRFSGQLDPRSIQAGNTVLSTQIANVRVEQRGRGAQADAQVMGWLGRVFLSVLPI